MRRRYPDHVHIRVTSYRILDVQIDKDKHTYHNHGRIDRQDDGQRVAITRRSDPKVDGRQYHKHQ